MNIKITLILKPLLHCVVLAILKTKNTPILLVKGGAGAGACDEHFIKLRAVREVCLVWDSLCLDGQVNVRGISAGTFLLPAIKYGSSGLEVNQEMENDSLFPNVCQDVRCVRCVRCVLAQYSTCGSHQAVNRFSL